METNAWGYILVSFSNTETATFLLQEVLLTARERTTFSNSLFLSLSINVDACCRYSDCYVSCVDVLDFFTAKVIDRSLSNSLLSIFSLVKWISGLKKSVSAELLLSNGATMKPFF